MRQLLYAPPGPDSTVPGATGTRIDPGVLVSYAGDADLLVDSLSALLLHGTLSADSHGKIAAAVNAQDPADLTGRLFAAGYLVLTSPLSQVER